MTGVERCDRKPIRTGQPEPNRGAGRSSGAKKPTAKTSSSGRPTFSATAAASTTPNKWTPSPHGPVAVTPRFPSRAVGSVTSTGRWHGTSRAMWPTPGQRSCPIDERSATHRPVGAGPIHVEPQRGPPPYAGPPERVARSCLQDQTTSDVAGAQPVQGASQSPRWGYRAGCRMKR